MAENDRPLRVICTGRERKLEDARANGGDRARVARTVRAKIR
jgi:hypothetical protein